MAHDALHSGKHSFLDFCSAPFGLVHSYKHLDRHASNSGSFLDPLDSSSLAKATTGIEATVPARMATNSDRDDVDPQLSVDLTPKAPTFEAIWNRKMETKNKGNDFIVVVVLSPLHRYAAADADTY